MTVLSFLEIPTLQIKEIRMSNDNSFLIKFLGVFMIEIRNVTPEKIENLIKLIAKLIFIGIFIFKLPEYINMFK